MTPEEELAAVRAEVERLKLANASVENSCSNLWYRLNEAHREAYEDAAKIAEGHRGGFEGSSHGADIAAAIREKAKQVNHT